MNVLFVSNAARLGKIDSLIENQSDSLLKKGITIEHFLLLQTGLKGYYKAIIVLRKLLKERNFDIIHAHYGFCGLVALLSRPSAPVIISFMGSDLHGIKIASFKDIPLFSINKFVSLIVQTFSKIIIIKSRNLLRYLYFKNKSFIIPNGVNTDLFFPASKKRDLEKVYSGTLQENILFLGNQKDLNKNYRLLELAYHKTDLQNTTNLLAPYPVKAEDIVLYLNACDVLVLCSFKEGSPNVIKEAMACNCPIVSTDVGDVKEVIGDTEGCYIACFDPEDISEKIEMALEFSRTKGSTNGRQRILELKLDAESIAGRIIEVYKKAINS
jgi:teichuronic acid biosynthesis glycosyltransferase TuaC